jgi:hypothetical protein
VTFLRLSRWHWLAFAAALALLLAMSLDWWTTKTGELARQTEHEAQQLDRGVLRQDIGINVRDRARARAEEIEKNAWQAPAFVDRLILILLLATIVAAIAAGFLRAAGRRLKPPWTSSTIAGYTGLFAAMLILYRILQPPGLNDAAVRKAGAPIALVLVGVLALAARVAAAVETEEPAAEPPPAAEPEPEQPPGPAEPAPS